MPNIKQLGLMPGSGPVSRRSVLGGSAAALGATMLPTLAMPAWAAETYPALGN